MLGPVANSTAILDNILALRNESAGNKTWSILSHISFVFLAIVGAWLGQKLTLVVALIVLFSSEIYHICSSFGVCMGLTEIQTWTNDRFTAPLSIFLVFYYFITWHDLDLAPQDWPSLDGETQRRLAAFHSYDTELLDQDDDGMLGARFNPPSYYLSWQQVFLTLAFVLSAMVTFNWPPGDLYPTLVVVILGVLGWLIYAILRNERDVDVGADRFMLGPTHPNWPVLLTGIILGGIGVGLYLIPETDSSLTHSFWHLFAGFALLALLIAKVMRPVEPLYVIELEWRLRQ